VPPRAETSPPVSDCDGGGRGGATAAGGSTTERPVGSLGGAEADEAEDEAAGGFFFLPFPCLDPARPAVGSCGGGGCGADWRLESCCLCVRKGSR